MLELYNIFIITEGNMLTWLCYKMAPRVWKTHITAPLRTDGISLVFVRICIFDKLLALLFATFNIDRTCAGQYSIGKKGKENYTD